MEIRSILAEIQEKLGNITETLNNTNEKYPFKRYLFESALKSGHTEISGQDEFNRNVEIYKKLKELTYLDVDKIDIVVDKTGRVETFTKDEAVLIVAAMEKKVIDVDTLLADIRKRVEETRKEPKIVVYTCITGGYDSIKEPSVVTPGVDYVCFTDNPEMKSKTWKIRPIPQELLSYSKVKQQRGVKILAHRYLPEYDISVWVDGNVDTRGNVKEYLKDFDFVQYSVFIPEHPARKCIYKEKDECVRQKKIVGADINLANEQMKRYRTENFPENYGLVQTNIMIRKHNDRYCVDLMEKWWSELKDYSHRDQLSFNYALWKVGKDRFKYLIKTTCNSRTFKWAIRHGKK